MTSKLVTPHNRRRPLRNLDELAEELGIAKTKLVAAMARETKYGRSVPACVIRGRNFRHASYYDLFEMRKWWAAIGSSATSTEAA